MNDVMRPLPYRELVLRALAELRKKGSIFDIPADHFWKQDDAEKPGQAAGTAIFSSRAANAVGPAAGPHTQLAQNILAAWLAGARYFELKTVQKLDELKVEKPCIDAADEGYNVEWSTELSLEAAADEYIKAWFLLHVFETLMSGHSHAPSFLFNMSVGYDLEGIKIETMNRFIDRIIDSSRDELHERYARETRELAADPGLLAGTPWEGRAAALRDLAPRVSPRISGSVTLSTMHGCPPGEIEAICAYMLTEKGLDTLVKLNPTLLGLDRVSEILGSLGYGYLRLNPDGFSKDLQYGDAVPMLKRLLALAGKKGKHFGAKLSNTLAVGNDGKVLPGSEKYMSGRALYPVTMSLAARLAEEFKGGLPLSFSGGVSAWNLDEVLACGIRPVTLATDLLKPGGYSRLKQLAGIASARGDGGLPGRVDAEKTRAAAESALRALYVRKEFRGSDRVRVEGPLPLFDCFVAPCVSACPIAQDVPEYVHLVGAGQFEKAFDVIYGRNPLPFMTCYLCDHQCTDNCTRLDWEGAVRIREVKRIAAERGYGPFVVSGTLAGRKSGSRGVKAAVIGAGPAGLAAAAFLAREGFEAHVFEREPEPGGVVRWLLPGFRLPADAIAKDVSLLRDLGVRFHFDQRAAPTLDGLFGRGSRYILVAIGAETDRAAGIEGAREALAFLREFREDPSRPVLGKTVAVIGAGDTAMDAARAAKRCRGVEEVRIVYRRSEKEMPASREEYEAARAEGVEVRFLLAPEAWQGGKLRCSVMELAEPDESGRSRPVATGRTEEIEADAVITAIGADVDSSALAEMGFPGPDLPFDPATQETSIDGVFLVGDAASGAATIVKAIASARRAVDAICAREGGSHFRTRPIPREKAATLRRERDGLIPVSGARADDAEVGGTESRRCLGCQAFCGKCVEVCPNRANTIVAVGGGLRDEAQIVHLDALCNECGNCATFCPWDGKPYRDKLTVFSSEEDFLSSANPGFFLVAGRGSLRAGGEARELILDEAGTIAPETIPVATGEDAARAALLEVVQVIVRDHPYLLGPVDMR
jgi:putative selenate reductase